jgi:drug/metabolite transporter (DMT)-like permease
MLAAPLLGERFGAVAALGGGLVLGGVYIGQRDREMTDSESAAADPESDDRGRPDDQYQE